MQVQVRSCSKIGSSFALHTLHDRRGPVALQLLYAGVRAAGVLAPAQRRPCVINMPHMLRRALSP